MDILRKEINNKLQIFIKQRFAKTFSSKDHVIMEEDANFYTKKPHMNVKSNTIGSECLKFTRIKNYFY
jgi:hypothetical protein